MFEQALEIYGVPSRVRTDKGQGLELKGEGRGSYIAASSVDNHQIEHLCQDVSNYMCSQYYYIF